MEGKKIWVISIALRIVCVYYQVNTFFCELLTFSTFFNIIAYESIKNYTTEPL